MTSTFLEHLRSHCPECFERSLGVACSGGADSVALVELLVAAKLTPTLLHVVHRRGADDAEAAARLVARLAEDHGLDHHRLDLAVDSGGHGSLESRWRTARYLALDTARQRLGLDLIVTAHHADDVAEGLLTQMLRGGGLRALAGIHRRDGQRLRPLLPFRRNQLRDYLVGLGRGWHEDPSNEQPRHLRNLVRGDLLPELEAVEPALRSHLVELAEQIAAAESALGASLAGSPRLDPWSPSGGVPLDLLQPLPEALRCRWLLEQCDDHRLPPPSRAQLIHFQDLLEGHREASGLRRRFRLRRHRHRLWLEPPRPLPLIDLALDGEGPWPWGFGGYQLERGEGGGASRWRGPWVAGGRLRSSHADDRLEDGRRLRRELHRWLPPHLAATWPVLTQGATILWLPGLPVGPEAALETGPKLEVCRR